jgi:hypothetical protein
MKMLLALDPGKTTGASLWMYDDETPLERYGHWQIEGGIYGCLEFLDQMKKFADQIVSESFVLDGRTPNPDTTPLQIEGALMAYWQVYRIPVVFQRNNFKKHVNDELLKKHNLYIKGEPHAMDSQRHAIAYMKTERHMPTLQKYFGEIIEE